MFEQYVEALQSTDAARRREAIIGLGRLADPRALRHLADVYRRDPDPVLRELAAKAGRHIQKMQQSGAAQSTPSAAETPPTVAPLPDILAAYRTPPAADAPLGTTGGSEPVSNMPGILAAYTRSPQPSSPAEASAGEAAGETPVIEVSPPAPIPPQRRQRARGYLQSAFTYKTRGDDASALSELAKALKADPALARESSAIGLAQSLVGGGGKDSIALVLKKSEDRGTRPQHAAFDPELIEMVLSLALLFIIVAVFNLALIYGTLIITEALVPMLFGGSASPAELRFVFNQFSLSNLLPDILRGSFITMFATLFQTMIVYFTGTLMGGVGAFVRFVKVMINFQIAFYVLVALSLGLMIVGVFSGSMSTFTTLTQIGAIALLVVIVGGAGAQAYLAARVQEFGFFKGFASVVLGSIAAGIIANVLGLFEVRGK